MEDKLYRRIYTIPDIHGRLDLLEKGLELLGADGYDASQDIIIFTGDFVDRGPDSKGVVETVKTLVEYDMALAVRGNHEGFIIDYYVKNRPHSIENWMYNGMGATLLSYSDVPGRPGVVSEDHVRFLGGLPLAIELQGFFFSHAPVPRESHRDGRQRMTGGDHTRPGSHYNLWELTWNYFGIECERKGAMMDVHEGPMANSGLGPDHLIGVCGHIHRGPNVKEVRIFKNYRMLDCGCGCFPTGRLAIHECISSRTMYADPVELYPDRPEVHSVVCDCGKNTNPGPLHDPRCSSFRP